MIPSRNTSTSSIRSTINSGKNFSWVWSTNIMGFMRHISKNSTTNIWASITKTPVFCYNRVRKLSSKKGRARYSLMLLKNMKFLWKPANRITKLFLIGNQVSENRSSFLSMVTKQVPSTWSLWATIWSISTTILYVCSQMLTRGGLSRILRSLLID